MISIIIPVYNEASCIAHCLQSLSAWRNQGCEIIVVDGESEDDTFYLAQAHSDLVCTSRKGRAAQMNTGARHAKGDLLLFLHADTSLPACSVHLRQRLDSVRQGWGRFDVNLSGRRKIFRLIAALINIRSRLTGIATGDQCLFVSRRLFNEVGGFPEIPIMEDVALSRLMRDVLRPVCLTERVMTSSRRWEEKGIARTILTMWYMRLAYFMGAKPENLARLYAC
ncbi:MAG: TIGR04283 family arsenosugar biosynthesis glycosyltransferase [Thiotrichales bacterium]|nr:TIGR04283 family arsenosugar biosynthesis glycosyltransferase [Thiotrichales bacterium]